MIAILFRKNYPLELFVYNHKECVYMIKLMSGW